MASPTAAEPFKPRLLRTSTDTSYDMRIVVDLELKLTAADLPVEYDLVDVPLIGKWTVKVHRRGEDVAFAVRHDDLGEGALGRRVVADICVDWQDGATLRPLTSGHFDARPSPEVNLKSKTVFTGWSTRLTPSEIKMAQDRSKGAFKTDEPRGYIITVNLLQAGLSSTSSAHEVARRVQAVGIKASPNDVRFFFPEIAGRPAAELWASERVLTTASSYFATLFSSGLAETVPVARARTPTGSSDLVVLAEHALKQFEDSDDELDQHVLGKKSFPLEADARVDAQMSYKQITISQAAYSTYRAVLLWLQTGYIAFAPVASSYPVDTRPTRMQIIESIHEKNPSLPLPASPKSVYRLAHILELDQLTAMAVRYFRDECLNLETAPLELFSDLSRDHAEWRSAVLEWLVGQWDEVKASEVWATTMQRIKDGEIEGAGPTMVELLEAIEKRKAVKP